MLRDEASQLSGEIARLRSEAAGTENQLARQAELTLKCQREAATLIQAAKAKSQEVEQELARVNEVRNQKPAFGSVDTIR